MNCPSCGATTAAEDTFCAECGARVDGRGAPTQETAHSPAPAESTRTPPLELTVTEPEARPPPREAAGPLRPAPRPRREAPLSNPLPRPQPDSPLLGQAMPNEQYLGMRLVYADGEAESLDPLTWRFIKALFIHWIIAGLAFWLFLIFLFLVGVRSSSTLSYLGLLWTAVWFFIPVGVSISEWKLMVDGQAAAAPQAFDHIAWVFHRRKTPVDRLSVRRLMLGGQASRDYLYVQLGVFRGYVSCFPFGDDLYIGWTFWWRLSTWTWWAILCRRAFQALTLRGSELHNILRYDNAKALREAIHGAAREGVDAASGAIAFQGTGTIGNDIPIEAAGVPREGVQRQPTGASA